MNSKTNKIIDYIMLLVIIILLIFISYLLLTKNDSKNNLKPSGNIDIFEIICDYNCECNKEDEPVFEQDDILEDITISDNKFTWQATNNLNIFSNPMYEMENKIAPEATNFYQFIIRNNTIYNIKYDIKFEEVNNYNINMKYRLIKNDEYVAGNEKEWVTYDELSLYNFSMPNGNKDTYYLEWKWFSSSNDTLIGETGDANYSLNIDIKAVQS